FFFSSRRRHTSSYGDWSSDVCSSDLDGNVVAAEGESLAGKVADGDVVAAGIRRECVGSEGGIIVPADVDIERQVTAGGVVTACRSEERRVGKSVERGGGRVSVKAEAL